MRPELWTLEGDAPEDLKKVWPRYFKTYQANGLKLFLCDHERHAIHSSFYKSATKNSWMLWKSWTIKFSWVLESLGAVVTPWFAQSQPQTSIFGDRIERTSYLLLGQSRSPLFKLNDSLNWFPWKNITLLSDRPVQWERIFEFHKFLNKFTWK